MGHYISKEDGFFFVTLGGKTFYRAKKSNLETIINMYDIGGDYRRRVMENVPSEREEWVKTTSDLTLGTGATVTVVKKTPVHPQKDHKYAFDSYSYVPERYGKSADEVSKRAEVIHGTDFGEKTWSDRLLSGEFALPSFALPKLNLPSLPGFGLKFKAIGTIIIIFVVGIIALVAIGYSGMGKNIGSVAEKEHGKKR